MLRIKRAVCSSGRPCCCCCRPRLLFAPHDLQCRFNTCNVQRTAAGSGEIVHDCSRQCVEFCLCEACNATPLAQVLARRLASATR